MKHLPIILIVLVALACSRVPGHIIDTDDMAEMLADMYMAESLVEMSHRDFTSDSARRALRQSVYAKYGVTAEEFDSSLMWYGQHFDIYMKVNERTVEILAERDKKLGSAILATSTTFFGDSVDVWPLSKFLVLNRRLPSFMIPFEIGQDDNQEKGDVYVWRVKVADDDVRTLRWYITAQYADSTSELMSTTTSSRGWNEVTFPTDTAKTLSSLRGFFEIVAESSSYGEPSKLINHDIWADSISLVRKRLNPDMPLSRSRIKFLPKL